MTVMGSGKNKNPRTDQKRVLLFWNGLASFLPEHMQCLSKILEDSAFQHGCNIVDLDISSSI